MPQNLTEEELEAGATCPRCLKRATEHLEDRTFECHDCGRTYKIKKKGVGDERKSVVQTLHVL